MVAMIRVLFIKSPDLNLFCVHPHNDKYLDTSAILLGLPFSGCVYIKTKKPYILQEQVKCTSPSKGQI